MSRVDNAQSYLLGMNAGDLEAALSAFAEDATYYGIRKDDGTIRRNLYGSKAEIRGYIGNWLKTASGGITYEIRSAREWGDCVLIEWGDSASGTGEHYDNEGILLFEFNDRDQIKHARAYQDFGPLRGWSFLEK